MVDVKIENKTHGSVFLKRNFSLVVKISKNFCIWANCPTFWLPHIDHCKHMTVYQLCKSNSRRGIYKSNCAVGLWRDDGRQSWVNVTTSWTTVGSLLWGLTSFLLSVAIGLVRSLSEITGWLHPVCRTPRGTATSFPPRLSLPSPRGAFEMCGDVSVVKVMRDTGIKWAEQRC